MIEGIVKKIMVGGIEKYAKLHNVQPEMVQIKVVNNENGTVFYKICNNFKEVESATFLQIMNKKMDLFGYESMSNPFMKKALVSYADETNDDVKNVSCFILLILIPRHFFFFIIINLTIIIFFFLAHFI